MTTPINGECAICGERGQVFDMPLYVLGSEGLRVCLDCRIALADVAYAMMRATHRRRQRAAYAKVVAQRKNAQATAEVDG